MGYGMVQKGVQLTVAWQLPYIGEKYGPPLKGRLKKSTWEVQGMTQVKRQH